MDGTKSPEEQELRAKVEVVRGRLQSLTGDLRAVDEAIAGLEPQREQHALLEQACGSLEKLGELGTASLFWGERIAPTQVAERLDEVRDRVTSFQAQLDALDTQRGSVLSAIAHEEEILDILGDDLYDVRQTEERRKLEWVVERDISPVPRRVQLMAWARGGEDDRRYRKTLMASLLAGSVFGAVLPMINLPLPKRFEPDDVPKRIAQLIRDEHMPLVPPPVQPKPREREKPEPQEPKPGATPKQTEKPDGLPPGPAVAGRKPGPSGAGPKDLPPGTPGPAGADPQARPGKAGILAFRDEFASLAKDKVAPRLGAEARYSAAAEAVKGSTRSMLTTNAPGSSGGINLASLSLSVGGGGGGGGGGALHGGGGGGGGGTGAGGGSGIGGGRVTSPIAGIGGDQRPLAKKGPGPSRTDEEIQIVFDRYKASFYRLYNRELRQDPTLRGQMVLRLTIEPDGSVSMCVLQSTDMDAPTLAEQVVNRVRTINFGAKEGVEALTIVYPIDFLPAA